MDEGEPALDGETTVVGTVTESLPAGGRDGMFIGGGTFFFTSPRRLFIDVDFLGPLDA